MTTPAIGGRWEARRLLAILTAFAVVATVIMVFSGTARAEHVDSWPFSSEANEADFWEQWGETFELEDDWTCEKLDDQGSDGTFEVPAPPAGEEWRLLIAKKGAGDDANSLFWNPLEGEEYEHATGGGYSHIILCSRPVDEETTTTVEDTTTTTVEETTTTVEDTTTTVEDTTTTVEETTTSSVDDTTTSSVDDTTTSSVDDSTTSSVDDSTTTSAEVEETTVTTAGTSTTATVEGTVVTTAPAEDPDDDLPFTGMNAESMLGISIALLGLGVALLTLTRKLRDNN
ncbi:MAG: hypothetical protein WD269_10885 [Acidimicrobiia bacterium]